MKNGGTTKMKSSEIAIATWPTRSDAARELDLSPERISQLINEGRLAAITTRLGRLINPDSLARMKREREARQAAE
jgi:hypothetical protein